VAEEEPVLTPCTECGVPNDECYDAVLLALKNRRGGPCCQACLDSAGATHGLSR
jgi:hypothetical protein